eukprot:TRINITY_DN113163_c0_g1_i1.p1 TRINITY_DN113163_c0_g1~~TRINITY_DN113163_c0_g1_i1.p1  ORF type:complete len:487 (+),score=53.95 TRINITY_DN113163_c0_g1_i1:128-1462(+)
MMDSYITVGKFDSPSHSSEGKDKPDSKRHGKRPSNKPQPSPTRLATLQRIFRTGFTNTPVCCECLDHLGRACSWRSVTTERDLALATHKFTELLKLVRPHIIIPHINKNKSNTSGKRSSFLKPQLSTATSGLITQQSEHTSTTSTTSTTSSPTDPTTTPMLMTQRQLEEEHDALCQREEELKKTLGTLLSSIAKDVNTLHSTAQAAALTEKIQDQQQAQEELNTFYEDDAVDALEQLEMNTKQDQMLLTQEPSILPTLFNISSQQITHHDNNGTTIYVMGCINQLRLGWLPFAQVPWTEFNAALGHTVLCVCALMSVANFNHSKYAVVPLGSQSHIVNIQEQRTLPLYKQDWDPQGWKIFDEGVAALCEYVWDLATATNSQHLLPYSIGTVVDENHVRYVALERIPLSYSANATNTPAWTAAFHYLLENIRKLLGFFTQMSYSR